MAATAANERPWRLPPRDGTSWRGSIAGQAWERISEDKQIALVDDLLGQAARLLEKANATILEGNTRNENGFINHSELLKRLDERIESREQNKALQDADGVWPRILKLFGHRYKYLLLLPPPAQPSGKPEGPITLIPEDFLMTYARNGQCGGLRPARQDGDGSQIIFDIDNPGRHRRSRRGVRLRLPDHNASTWFRTGLLEGGRVKFDDMRPFEYKGRVIDCPDMILAQAKVHLRECLHEGKSFTPYLPEPTYVNFDLEEYLDHLVLYDRLEPPTSTLEDVKETRRLLAAQTKAKTIRGHGQKLSSIPFKVSTQRLKENANSGPSMFDHLQYYRFPPVITYRLEPRINAINCESDRQRFAFGENYLHQQDTMWEWRKAALCRENTSGAELRTLPANWKGPIVFESVSQEVEESRNTLRCLIETSRQLRSAERKAPRRLIKEVIQRLDAGLKGEPWEGNSQLRFHDDEYELSARTELRSLEAEETKWLADLAEIPIEASLPNIKPTDKDAVLIRRVGGMLQTLDPTGRAVFRDAKRAMSLQVFEKEVNSNRAGAVKRIRQDVTSFSQATKLASWRLIRLKKKHGEYTVRRPNPLWYPENVLVWRLEDITIAEYDRSQLNQPPVTRGEEENNRMRHLPTGWRQEHDRKRFPDPKEDNWNHTANFFRCLAFRLGLNIRRKLKEYRENFGDIRSTDEKEALALRLRACLHDWVKSVPLHDENRGPRLDDEAFRKSIIRELFENKNPLLLEGHGPPDTLWMFGHPMNKRPAPRFFDVNRWPLVKNDADTNDPKKPPRRQGGLDDWTHRTSRGWQVWKGSSSGESSEGDDHGNTRLSTAQKGSQEQTGKRRRGNGPEHIQGSTKSGPYTAEIPNAELDENGRSLSRDTASAQHKTYHNEEFLKGDTPLHQFQTSKALQGRKRRRQDAEDGDFEEQGEDICLSLPTPAFIPKSRPKSPKDDRTRRQRPILF